MSKILRLAVVVALLLNVGSLERTYATENNPRPGSPKTKVKKNVRWKETHEVKPFHKEKPVTGDASPPTKEDIAHHEDRGPKWTTDQEELFNWHSTVDRPELPHGPYPLSQRREQAEELNVKQAEELRKEQRNMPRHPSEIPADIP